VKFPQPIEQPLDDKHSLLIHSARLKGGSPFVDVSVYNGVPLHQDEIYIATSKGRSEFAKQVKNRVGIDEDITEKSLLIVSSHLTTTYADELEKEQESEAKPNQATTLVELASTGTEFFHDASNETYATIEVNGHKETWRIKVSGFRNWLSRRYYKETGGAASAQALQDALGTLQAQALFDGSTLPVFLRVAEDKGNIYVDLCNENWEAVEITSTGWRVVADPPVKFRRAPGMLPLPYPVVVGSIDELRPFINLSSNSDWALFCSWLVQAIRPVGPYPVLVFHGEQGSAKSTAQSMARALIDPNSSPLRTEPRSEHDLVIAASNGWCICLDNLSNINVPLSDAICRLSTGGGFSTRQLYTDSDEVLFNAQRTVLINGIEELVTRGDLLDRSLIIYLPSIPDNKRRPQSELWADFDGMKPRILGALYDAVSCAMRRLPTTKLAHLPRLADFAMWASAAETSFGFPSGTFLSAYSENRQSANDLVLESSAVAAALLAFAEKETVWLGSATELLKELNTTAAESTRQLRTWPRDGRGLSNRARRLAPNLRAAGVAIEFDLCQGKRKRLIRLEWVGIPSSVASATSATGVEAEDIDSAKSTEAEDKQAGEDAKDAEDAKKQACSDGGINLDFSYCPTCGLEGPRFTECPECGDLIR
jgi:hypothetical protein